MPATKKTVVVTGFGPFGPHKVNASWEVVKCLESQGDLGEDITLVTTEIPVTYEAVKQMVPQLWDQYKPALVVHCGVSGIANALILEQIAHNDGYNRHDEDGVCPDAFCCKEGSAECLKSAINMGQVCLEANKMQSQVEILVSHDPGRYLCEFSFYQSLSIDHGRSAFVHVPPVENPYSVEDMAEGLRCIILCMLKQVS